MANIQQLTCVSVTEGKPFGSGIKRTFRSFLRFSDGQEGQRWSKTPNGTDGWLDGPRWYRIEERTNEHGTVLVFSPPSGDEIREAEAQQGRKSAPAPATKEQPPIPFPPSPVAVAHVQDDLIVTTATEATVRLIAAGLVPIDRMRPAMERLVRHMREVVGK